MADKAAKQVNVCTCLAYCFQNKPYCLKQYNSVHHQSRKEEKEEIILECLTNARENFFQKTGDNSSIVKSSIKEFTSGKAERSCDVILNKWKRPVNYLRQIFEVFVLLFLFFRPDFVTSSFINGKTEWKIPFHERSYYSQVLLSNTQQFIKST